jgi:DNA-binding SARP family transcriptional activator
MKPFDRKREPTDPARSEQPGDESAGVSHRFTLSLDRAERLAAMLARSRASWLIEIADLLAGMYISDWERLSKYWDADRREEVETVLRSLCQISPPRWHSWMEGYDRARREGAQRQFWRLLLRLEKKQAGDRQLKPSAALAAVLKQAEEIAPYRDRVEDRTVPILTSECVLLCILRYDGSEISRKLAETGLNTTKLEREALFPRHHPLV